MAQLPCYCYFCLQSQVNIKSHHFLFRSFLADLTILRQSLLVQRILERLELLDLIMLLRFSSLLQLFRRIVQEAECWIPRSTTFFIVFAQLFLLGFLFVLWQSSSSLLLLLSNYSLISCLLVNFLLTVFAQLILLLSSKLISLAFISFYSGACSTRLQVVLDRFLNEEMDCQLLMILLDLMTPVRIDSIFLRSSKVLCVARMIEDMDLWTFFPVWIERWTSMISQTDCLIPEMMRFTSVRKSEKYRIIQYGSYCIANNIYSKRKLKLTPLP